MGGSFKKLFAKIDKTLSFKKEKAKVDFTIELQELMKKRQISRADLARELNKSNAYVTQIMRGERNFTIETMVELADALESDIAIHLSPKGENSVDWSRATKNSQGQRSTSAWAPRRIYGLNEEILQDSDMSKYFKIREPDGYAVAA